MALELDTRQRAMLQEMGVRVWLPGTAFATELATEPQPVAPAVAAAGPVAPTRPAPLASAPLKPVASAVAAPTVQALDTSALGWDGLVQTVQACQACGLCAGRKNTTLRAPAHSQMDWMVVGDPPDEDEDREGQPFAQAQGQLLDNMLKAVGASRAGSGAHGAGGAYVTNITKCRPPHGRIPQPAELAQCAAYLRQEIALVQPKIILAMGRFAMQVLLGEQPQWATQPLGKLRGAVYQYQGVPVVVTYAPKVLLRAPADKAKAWADLCLAMDTLEAL